MIGRCAAAAGSFLLLAVAVTSDALTSFLATVWLLAILAKRAEARHGRQ
ncbi:MAG TPA: hypothetical protein VE990_09810 [Acidimicrobiales bacterium]|nr:hypothetical protein [Acidimicrobiales bacterium]